MGPRLQLKPTWLDLILTLSASFLFSGLWCIWCWLFPSYGEQVMQRPALLMVGLANVMHAWECWKCMVLVATDLLAQALAANPNNFLPRPGICGAQRPDPRAYRQQTNRNGTVLSFRNIQSQLNAPFCLAMIVNPMGEGTLLYIYETSLTPVGSLTVNSDNIVFNLNGQSAFLLGNFTTFTQIQICANGTHMNLYVGCQFSMAMPFSARGVSETAAVSLFTPFFQSTPQFGVSESHLIILMASLLSVFAFIFQGPVQQLYISSCPAVPIQSQVNAQCTSQPADCTLPYVPIQNVFNQLVLPAPATS